MRPTPWLLAEPYRFQPPGYESDYGDAWGAFRIPYHKTGAELRMLVSDGQIARGVHGNDHAWDHVSVSTRNRCPNWLEMSFVKDLFWLPTEVVMQLHVAAADHINNHPYTLHLWKPLLVPVPVPPLEMV